MKLDRVELKEFSQISNPADIPAGWGPGKLEDLKEFWKRRALKGNKIESLIGIAKTLGDR